MLLCLSVQPALGAPAGWTDDERLTFTGNCGSPVVSSNNDTVHVFWYTDTNPMEVYYRRSLDRGFSWGSRIQISNSSGEAPLNVDAVVDNETIHVVWDRTTSGPTVEVFYVRSEDNGDSWTDPVQISEYNNSDSRWPGVGCWQDEVYVVFGDDRDGDYHEIYFKRSLDGGNTWSNDKRLTVHQTGTDEAPSIIANGSKLHVVWTESTGGSPSTMETMYMNSTDRGGTWSSDVMLSSDNDYHSIFSGPEGFAVEGNNLYVVWKDLRHLDGGEIYYRKSNNSGLSWETETRLINDPNVQGVPAIGAEGDFISVVWGDTRDYPTTYAEIYNVNSTDSGENWSPEVRLTNIQAYVGQPDIMVGDGYQHLVWFDNRTADNEDEVYYKRNPDFASPIPEFSNLLIPVLTVLIMIPALQYYINRKS